METETNQNTDNINLAKLEQKMEDHCAQQEKDFKEVKSTVKEIMKEIHEMKNILVKGDGKIRSNQDILDKHITDHKWWAVFIVSICAICATIASAVFTNLK